jgi:hypothetical protein
LFYLIYAVVKYSVEVPFWDQWDLVPYLEKLYQGTLTFADLYSQHNEHRILFPRIIMLALARLTSWNTSYEIGVNLVLGTAIFFVLVRQLRATAASTGGSGSQWLIPVLALIVFSLAQWENWLWGWQLQIFLNVLAVAAAVLLLANPPFTRIRFAGAAAMGVVATYSFANGVAVWFSGLIALCCLLYGYPERRAYFARATLIWIIIGTAAIWSYLYGYVKPPYHPSVWVAVEQPFAFLRYEATYLFAPVAPNPLTFVLTLPALAGACYFSWLLVRAKLIRIGVLAPYLALASYVVASAIITGIGRVGIGAGQAGQSRYLTINSLLWVSVAILLWVFISRWKSLPAAPGRKSLRVLGWYSIVVIVYLASLRSIFGLDFAAVKEGYLIPARNELLTGKDVHDWDDELWHHVYNRREVLGERVKVLQRYHLSVFRDGGKGDAR